METDKLIKDLSEETHVVTCCRCPFQSSLLGLAAIGIFLYIIYYFVGFREDITLTSIYKPLLWQIIFVSATIITAVIALSFQSFPDLSEYKLIRYLPLLPLSGFAGVFILQYLITPPDLPVSGHGMQCAMEMCIMSLVPVVVLYAILARGIFLHARTASWLIALASGMTGYLALRLAEHTDNVQHLFLWHILPLIGLVSLLSWLHHRWLKNRRAL